MNIAALVSGGVDSAVALREVAARHPGEVTAYYLKIWLEDELSFLGECPWEEDLRHARAVCEQAGVPLRIVPLQREYYDRVVEYTLQELRAGRTPSPDIFCNQRVKFGAFLEAVPENVDRVATGHYAVRRETTDGVELWRSPDPVKDQTYFLSHLSQAQMRQAWFPIGHLTKQAVRRRAQELQLPNRDRPDSQGICFLGKIRYSDFVRHYLGERDGAIREYETDRELGRHRGAWFYTIGQRQGLGLGNGPWYVVRKNLDDNTVWVSHQERAHATARNRFETGELTWIGAPPAREELFLKIRHGPDLIPARVTPGNVPGRLSVEMAHSDRGVAPGQFAVFYDGEQCLGSGKIMEQAA